MVNIVETVAKSAKKIAQDDPRRIIHSMKVGLAVTLVSLFYFYRPIFQDFGTSTLWAVLTVVVVFEYSVGATLGKGLNRELATLIGGAFAVGVHTLATQCGHIGEPLLVSIFVFLQAAVSTFARFSPTIKSLYDYGFLIFILTFSFISVSGFRAEEILELARNRWATIVIGVLSSLLISTLIFPVWAGEDLHNLIANNIENLGNSLEGYGNAYFKVQESKNEQEIDVTRFQTYKSALNSKNTEETLANLARWEPSHGRFRFKHPWKQYLKLGALTRQCAYRIEALDKHVIANIKKPSDCKNKIADQCYTMTLEASKTLKELANDMKNMTQPSTYKTHIAKSRNEIIISLHENISKSTELLKDYEMLEGVIEVTTIVSILTDIISCIEILVKCTSELASMAHFKGTKDNVVQVIENQDSLVRNGTQGQNNSTDVNIVNCSHISLTIE